MSAIGEKLPQWPMWIDRVWQGSDHRSRSDRFLAEWFVRRAEEVEIQSLWSILKAWNDEKHAKAWLQRKPVMLNPRAYTSISNASTWHSAEVLISWRVTKTLWKTESEVVSSNSQMIDLLTLLLGRPEHYRPWLDRSDRSEPRWHRGVAHRAEATHARHRSHTSIGARSGNPRSETLDPWTKYDIEGLVKPTKIWLIYG